MKGKIPLLLTAVAGVAALVQRRQAARAEQDLWAEATRPPDLR
ncbi:MAG: DLW-39 family protein [Actinomycetota bacterium]|nr:DLW-39 family protein [Actinomycetota bacterium]